MGLRQWRAWESRGRRRRSPVNGRLERLVASGLAAIPPNSHADLQWAMAGLRAATSMPLDKQTGKIKTCQN